MFDNLSQRLSRVVKQLRGEARLTDANIQDALREVRLALLEADVALPVVKDFIAKVRDKAVGEEVVGSLTPGQAFVGVVHRELAALMGGAAVPLDFAVQPPAVVLLAGLQGAGKTTTAAKLAHLLRGQKKKVLVVSADVYRPAAIEQLATLAAQVGVDCLPVGGRREAGGDRRGRARLGAEALPRRADRRHRGAPRDRRGDDARDRGAARGGEAGRDAVRRRCDAGPGRRQHGARVPRGAAADGRDPDQARRRRARRRRAVGAPRHRRADQVRRRLREDRRPRGVPSRADGLAHPRHGRRAVADRGGAQDDRRRGSAEVREEGQVRQGLRPRRLQDRRSRRCARWAGCRRCWTSCRPSSRARRRTRR